MDCFECKGETTLAVNTSQCRLCVKCYHTYDPSKSDDIKNDVLYHLFYNRNRTTYATNAKVCETKYGEPAVIKARDYLLSKVKAKFENIDEDLIKPLETERRTSSGPNGRTKAAATINDIHSVLQVLETEIEVIPADVENVMDINPESLLSESVVARIEELERKLGIQTEAVETLKGELKMLSTQRPLSVPAAADLETNHGEDAAPTSIVEEASTAAKTTDDTGPIAGTSGNVEPAVMDANDLVGQSGAALVINAATPGVAGNPANSSAATRKMAGALKHKRNLDAQNIAAMAAAQAAHSGLSMDESAKVGTAAATQLVKSYAGSLKLNRSGNKTETGTVARGQNQTPQTTLNPSSHMLPRTPRETQGQSEQWKVQGNSKRKKRLALSVPYQKGTAAPIVGFSIARTKPLYEQNEALVVSGLPTEINGTMMKAYINSKAGREVELQKVVWLDREYAGWAAVVIELSKDDYTELSNPDFWQEGVYIRPWTGQRFWRGAKQKFLTHQERMTSVRRQWVEC